MEENVYYIFAAIGIVLTFMLSLTATVVSIVSVKKQDRNQKMIAQQSKYLETITPARERWQYAMRESGAKYLEQIARICYEDTNFEEIFANLNRYHNEVILISWYCDSLHNRMNDNLDSSSKIVELSHDFNKNKAEIERLRSQIKESQVIIKSELQKMIKEQWYIQKHDADEMWEEKRKG